MKTQNTDEDKGTGLAAPYVSWATFKNAIIDGLQDSIPNQIDRSVFHGLAGGVQSQLMVALKFLGLTDAGGKPTKHLTALIDKDEEKRKQALAAILQRRYTDLFALGIENATVKQVHDKMEAYGLSGETKDKALRFFLGAAQYAEIPLSRHLINGVGSVSTRRRPATRRAAGNEAQPNSLTETGTPVSGMHRTVTLASGGNVILTGSFDPFKLSHDDREFVYGLVDKMTEYEAANARDLEDSQ